MTPCSGPYVYSTVHFGTMFWTMCLQYTLAPCSGPCVYCTLWHHVLVHVCTVHFDTMFWSMFVLYTLTPGPCVYCTLWHHVLDHVCTVHFNTMFWTMCVLYTLTPCFWTMCVLYTLTPCSGPCVYCTLWHHVLVHVCTVHFNTMFWSMSVLYTFFLSASRTFYYLSAECRSHLFTDLQKVPSNMFLHRSKYTPKYSNIPIHIRVLMSWLRNFILYTVH